MPEYGINATYNQRKGKKEMNDYTIYPSDWELFSEDSGVIEWKYFDYDIAARFTLRMNKKGINTGTLNLMAESFTYYGDSNYYWDIPTMASRPYLTDIYCDNLRPLNARTEDDETVMQLPELFDEYGDIAAYITIPAEFVDMMNGFEEDDAFADSLAYKFSEFAEQHHLAVDDSADVSANIEAYLARNVPGCSQYGFADVPCELADAVEHFFYECYKPRTRYAA